MSKLRAWIAGALLPLWRWKWLLLVLLVATSGYALFSMAAENRYITNPPVFVGPGPPLTPTVDASFGWPRPYLHRSYQLDTQTARWTIWRDVTGMQYWALAANVGVACGLSLVFTWCVAWRCSTVQRWQFRLLDLMALTVVIAAVLGMARSWENNYRTDRDYLNSLALQGCIATRARKPIWYRRPLGDLGIVSREALYPLELNMGASLDPKSLAAISFGAEYREEWLLQETSRGHQLRHPISAITMRTALLSDEGVEALVRWAPCCERLDFHGNSRLTDDGIERIVTAWPMLTELTLDGPRLTSKSIQSLSSLRRLETLRIDSCSKEMTITDLQPLLQLRVLREVYLPNFLARQLPPAERETFASRGVTLTGPIARRLP